MLRGLMTFSGFTLMSRILGFLRDILIGALVGTSMVADAFNAAFRFPNMFRRIFGEGAFNSAFVPLFGKRVAQDGRFAAMGFANNAFSVLFLVLGVLTLALIPLMSWVMLAVVPGFLPKAEHAGGSEASDFRIALRGAKAVYFQVEDECPEIQFHDLTLVRKGEREFTKVFAEIFGGEVQAVGETVSLESVINEGLKRKGEVEILESDSEEEIAAAFQGARERIIRGDEWVVPDNGILRVPLPPGHDYAVFTGAIAGEGQVKVFRNDPGAFALTVKLSKITFVYLLCMALVAHLGGVLTTLKKFAAPAFSPVLLNIVFLIGLTCFARITEAKGELLAWCVAIAGFVQLGLLWWTCRRARLPVAIQKPVFDSDIKRLFVLMGPGILAAGIQQINLLVGGIIASFQQGAISTLYYSDRVYQLPLGMVGIAFGMVLLPEITRLLTNGKESEAAGTMRSAIELAMIITVPAAVAFVAIPHEIMSLLFERGAFTPEDSRRCGQALAAFSIGLPGYVLIKVLQPGYFARENTKSPMIMGGVTVAVNIVVSLILFPFMGLVGIALATSIAAWVNVLLLWKGLKGFVSLRRENWRRLGGMLAASLVMAAGLYGAKEMMETWLAGGFWTKFIATSLLISFGATVYSLGVIKLRVTSVAELKNAFKK